MEFVEIGIQKSERIFYIKTCVHLRIESLQLKLQQKICPHIGIEWKNKTAEIKMLGWFEKYK